MLIILNKNPDIPFCESNNIPAKFPLTTIPPEDLIKRSVQKEKSAQRE
ncbi:hypothetical protein PCO86_06320 [Pectobacteriaceae bacterium CE70]|nr:MULTISPECIES: hypothetical protein [Enterobacterales]WJV63634.1 hypothetical protein PCO87_06135 [Pectobacteriaceae bacterium C52]WJV68026.1 hypothetical protein PCO86_06320 [Pectobacteriaceae bacterium CE70]WJY11968.1 hypothetical protein PCO80_06155 [Pectobacteriaceae bacterium C80]